MNEIWRSILNFENLYEISNFGRIRRIQPSRRLKAKRILKPIIQNGYAHITLCKDNKKIRKQIHRLVLEAFVSLCPKNMECNHKNGIKDDNRLDNLEWCTKSQNIFHMYNKLGIKLNQGVNNGMSKLKEKDIFKIRESYRLGDTPQKISNKFGVSSKTIRNVINKQTWKHI